MRGMTDRCIKSVLLCTLVMLCLAPADAFAAQGREELLTSQTLATPAGKALLDEQQAVMATFARFQGHLVEIVKQYAPDVSVEMTTYSIVLRHQTKEASEYDVTYGQERRQNIQTVPAMGRGLFLSARLNDMTIIPDYYQEKGLKKVYYETPRPGKAQNRKKIAVNWSDSERRVRRVGIEQSINLWGRLGSEIAKNLKAKIDGLLDEVERSLPAARRIAEPLEDYKAWLYLHCRNNAFYAPYLIVQPGWVEKDAFLAIKRDIHRSGPNVFHRVQRDLNHDGVMDMAITDLSQFIDTVGLNERNGLWRVYLGKRSGGYRYVGTPALGIDFRVTPLAPGTARLAWDEAYRRCEGHYAYEINPSGLHLIKAEFIEHPRANEN